VICSLVYITVDCLLSVSSNHDLFPLILTFFAESDMLLSQNLFHILKRVVMYGC
jgi:hypothetical protein